MRKSMSWCLIGCLFIAAGCRSTAWRTTEPFSGITGTETSALDSPSAETLAAHESTPPWTTMTFAHKPEFREGTGPVDSGDLPDFSSTDSGLRYRILRQSGGKKPTRANTVTVKYRGWLNSGKIFDSSYERGEPTTFPLNKVVPGWTEGMQLVGEGGMIELWVPSKLGYGKQGSPGSIPPHSHLHFIVELVSVD